MERVHAKKALFIEKIPLNISVSPDVLEGVTVWEPVSESGSVTLFPQKSVQAE